MGKKKRDRKGRHPRPGTGGGRTTPKGTRPRHLRAVPAGLAGSGSGFGAEHPADEILRTGGEDLLAESDALAAEVWASRLLALFDGVRAEARRTHGQAPPFETMILDRARARPGPGSLAVAAALAAVSPEPIAGRAGRVVEALRAAGVDEPAWVGATGSGRLTGAWRAGDVFGDQDALILGVAHDDVGVAAAGRERALVVLVDHNLDGRAKDAWVGDDLSEVVAAWRGADDPHMTTEQIPLDEACRRVADAMAETERWAGGDEGTSEDLADHRALIQAWLARAGHADRDPRAREPMSPAERDGLVEDFLADPAGHEDLTALGGEGDAELLAGHLVDLRTEHGGDPLRWSPQIVAAVLLDLVPRKVILEPSDAAALPAVTRAWIRYAGRRTGRSERWVGETVDAVDDMERDYLDLISDPSAGGPGKLVLRELMDEGVDLGDHDAVQAAVDRINRRGGLGALGLGPGTAARRRVHRPVEAPPDVVRSAAEAVALARFEALAGFYGKGRKLTATGNPTLADARSLVEQLALADRFDETIGARAYKTRSAEELPELTFTLKWAVTSGVLRKQHGKLMATASWAQLGARPLDRFVRTADAAVSLGPLATRFRRSRPGFRAVPEAIDETLPLVLGRLALGETEFEAVVDRIHGLLDERFEWRGYLADPAARCRSIGRDLELLFRIFGWAGITERIGAVAVPDDLTGRPRLEGGTVRLTPAGAWWWER